MINLTVISHTLSLKIQTGVNFASIIHSIIHYIVSREYLDYLKKSYDETINHLKYRAKLETVDKQLKELTEREQAQLEETRQLKEEYKW